MMAVILAGGKGTRLKPFTLTIPKPLMPLGEVPIIEVVISQLRAAGVERIVIALGHLSHLFKATVGDSSRWGVEMEYYCEEKPLGTAGSLRMMKDLDDDFLVMNGDTLTTINYADLFRKHKAKKVWGTITVHKREVKIDYGVIEPDRNGMLGEYIEKPTIPYFVSMGVYVLSKRCVELIPAGRPFDMPDLMKGIKKAGQRVYCYETDCYWQDIGRFDDYQQASEDFSADPDKFLPAGGK